MANSSALDLPENYTLIDDSRNASQRCPKSGIGEEAQSKGTFQIDYFGLDAREKLLDHLIRAEPQLEDSIRFFLDREAWGALPTYGLSRTPCCCSRDNRVLVFDDDVLCEAVRSPLPAGTGAVWRHYGRRAAFWDSDQPGRRQKDTQRLPAGTDDPPTGRHPRRRLGIAESRRHARLGAGKRKRHLHPIPVTPITYLADPLQHLGRPGDGQWPLDFRVGHRFCRSVAGSTRWPAGNGGCSGFLVGL